MVIKSRKLYVEMCKFVRQYYGEKGDPAICTMRSQLLMALHDSGQAAELCAHDPTHKLAWWVVDSLLREVDSLSGG
eukprot:7555324-Pyramimonas_sp.AAC.1